MAIATCVCGVGIVALGLTTRTDAIFLSGFMWPSLAQLTVTAGFRFSVMPDWPRSWTLMPML